MNLDVQWFCRLAVDRALVTAQLCAGMLLTMGEEPELMAVAQTLIDNGLCPDLDRVQGLVDEAFERAQSDQGPYLGDIEGAMAAATKVQQPLPAEPDQTVLMARDGTTQVIPRAGAAGATSDVAPTQVMDGVPGAAPDGTGTPAPAQPGATAQQTVPMAKQRPGAAHLFEDEEEELDDLDEAGMTASVYHTAARIHRPLPELDDGKSLGDLVSEAMDADAMTNAAAANFDFHDLEEDEDEEATEDELGDEEEDEEARIIAQAPVPLVQDFGKQLPRLEDLAQIGSDEAAERLKQLLSAARAMGASDVHLSAGAAPFVRIHGNVRPLTDEPLSAEASREINMTLLKDKQRQRFVKHRDLTLAMQFEDFSRYRVNLVLHKEGVAGTYHMVPKEIKSLAQLGFRDHRVISKLLDHHNGLILVTGPAGSGKTTTLAALVEEMNHKRYDHIITVEDPIEFLFHSRRCFVTQREVGKHTVSFSTALKGALREDPDIIVIGELHDLETIEMAITAAETGHLVIGTLHTSSAANTLNRLLGVFPPTQQSQIRAMTSESLRGIVCQQLIPRQDGRGVVPAYEIYVNTSAGARIIRDGAIHHLAGVMQTGIGEGMKSMDQCLSELFKRGVIDEDTAAEYMRSKEMLKRARANDSATGADTRDTAADPVKSKKGWFR